MEEEVVGMNFLSMTVSFLLPTLELRLCFLFANFEWISPPFFKDNNLLEESDFDDRNFEIFSKEFKEWEEEEEEAFCCSWRCLHFSFTLFNSFCWLSKNTWTLLENSYERFRIILRYSSHFVFLPGSMSLWRDVVVLKIWER